jgi:hypothetical protein
VRPQDETTFAEQTLKYVAPLLGLVGTVLFGVLRLAYTFFYQQLRATPQEVGYGYEEILSGQLFGTLELALLLTTALVAGAHLARALRHAQAGRWSDAVALPRRRDLTQLGRRYAIIALAAILIVLPALAYLSGAAATEGYAIRNMYLISRALPVLAVQASPAEVTWTVAQHPGMTDLLSLHCLLYLGQANGTAVFYDVKTRDSLHLPTAQIQITLPLINKVDDACS